MVTYEVVTDCGYQVWQYNEAPEYYLIKWLLKFFCSYIYDFS